jgi:exonuclease SbcD
VTGQEFHAELDRRNPILDYCVVPEGKGGSLHERSPEAHFAIHLTHGMLLEKPFIEGSAHTLLDQVMAHTVADVTFGGHYHPGWSKVYEADGRLFINPGALVRMGAQAADWERPIQVVLLELQAGEPIRWQLIPLRSAPPAEAVLDFGQKDLQMERERALADFLQGVGEASQFEVLEVQSIMERVAESEGVPEPVRREALRRLGLAQEELARGEEEEA